MTVNNSKHFEQLQQPNYQRSQLKSRIIHIGCGAFHRAHQALYTHEWLNKSQSDWGICEVSLFGGGEFIAQLREQNHLFTVLEKGSGKSELKLVGAVNETLHAGTDGRDAVLRAMTNDIVSIVSLTITEKGYCIDASSGTLDQSHLQIQKDLQHPHQPSSAIGYIVEALRIRKEQGKQAFTVLSCDNVQENGKVAKTAIVEYASLIDQGLALWIELNATFPCTMVDRIVPAATEETFTELQELIGEPDPCGIACEPFRQWVIEDNFVSGRPDWDEVGAEFVSNVIPYEEMKLRMLNGSHSFLAYLGYLAGFQHISDTMRDPHFRVAAYNMMIKAQAPTLDMPSGTNLEAYALKLIERFSNQSLKHKTWQIALDGSQKIPQRFGASIRYHLQHDTDYRWLALAIAGWMRYVYAKDEQGELIEVVDPMVDTFQDIYIRHGLNAGVVAELLSLESIFGADLSQHKGFVTSVTNAYQLILDRGAAAAVALLEQ
jgi:fructuronate reductase